MVIDVEKRMVLRGWGTDGRNYGGEHHGFYVHLKNNNELRCFLAGNIRQPLHLPTPHILYPVLSL
jgi:hypothetical protein